MIANENFYVQKKDYWLKFYRSIIKNKKVNQLVFQKYFTAEKIDELKLNIQQEFEDLLPQIPDFGIKEITPPSRDMIKTTLSLAFYRILKAEGLDLHTIGQIFFEISEAFYMNQNPLRKFLMRRIYFSKHQMIKKEINKREKSVDPNDYHYTFVEGNENLLFGINITNCGGLYFLRQQNALEIAPYLCLCDYPMYRGFKIGFNRSQNLAIGGTMCTFRFYRDYPTPKGWPPEEVDEYKSFKFKNV